MSPLHLDAVDRNRYIAEVLLKQHPDRQRKCHAESFDSCIVKLSKKHVRSSAKFLLMEYCQSRHLLLPSHSEKEYS